MNRAEAAAATFVILTVVVLMSRCASGSVHVADAECANRCGAVGYSGAFERDTACFCGTPAPSASRAFDPRARLTIADAACGVECGRTNHSGQVEVSVGDGTWACWCLDPAPAQVDPKSSVERESD